MFKSFRKSVLFHFTEFVVIATRRRTSSAPPLFPRFLSSSLPIRALSFNYTTSTISTKDDSFTINYLINTCGFPPESALSASKYILLRSSEQPDSVLSLFRSLGFSDSDLRFIIRKAPSLLVINPTNTLLPKLQFLQSKGASVSQLVRIVTKNPRFLIRSLDNHIIPTYNLINKLLQSDQRSIITITRSPNILSTTGLQRNIEFFLDEAGICKAALVRLLRHWPWLISYDRVSLRSMVDEIKEMGIHPSKIAFIPAMYAKNLPKSMWESKAKLYNRLGWTDEVIHRAFVKQPYCMLISERKIEEGMEFLVNRMGWDPLLLAKYPVLLMLSLNKRIIPRSSVLEFLQSRGLIKRAIIPSAYYFTEDRFLEKYVKCFEDQAPQLPKLYEEKMNLAATG